MVKLIAVDMDGTFLNSKKEYDVEMFERLYNEMQDKNIIFMVASGNQYEQISSFFDKEKNMNIIFASENGALIKHKDDEIYHNIIDNTIYENTLKLIEEYEELYTGVSTLSGCYVKPHNELYDSYKFYFPLIHQVDNLHNLKDVLKLSLNAPKGKTDYYVDLINSRIDPSLHAINCGEDSLDIISKGITKANAINIICKMNNITLDDCACFGDSDNDLEMIKACKYSYAMSNGLDSIKSIAYEIIQSNDENAVLNKIEEIIK